MSSPRKAAAAGFTGASKLQVQEESFVFLGVEVSLGSPTSTFSDSGCTTDVSRGALPDSLSANSDSATCSSPAVVDSVTLIRIQISTVEICQGMIIT